MDNPILWILFAVVAILCVVMLFVAGKSARSREQRMKAFYQKANRQQALYQKYQNARPEEMKNDAPEDVIEGLAVAAQRKIEDAPSADEAFVLLPLSLQYAYAAYYFFEDSEEKLSAFFRKNGEPLLHTAVDCICGACPDCAVWVRNCYDMLDENNEHISVEEEKLDEWSRQFAALRKTELQEQVKQFILRQMQTEQNGA